MLKKLLSITQLPGLFIVHPAALLGFVQTSLTFTNHWNSGEFVPNFTLPHTSTWDIPSYRQNRVQDRPFQPGQPVGENSGNFIEEFRSLKLSWSSASYQNYTNGPFLLGVETDFRLKFSATEKENFSPLEFPRRLCEKMIIPVIQKVVNLYLGGGNSNMFGIFTPILGVSWSNLTSIFFKGVGSTTN